MTGLPAAPASVQEILERTLEFAIRVALSQALAEWQGDADADTTPYVTALIVDVRAYWNQAPCTINLQDFR